MKYNTIKYEIKDHILTITLNRPDLLNAFDVAMADELENAFHSADVDDEIRVIVVTGQGRAFCAGMDLSVEGNVFGLDETAEPTLSDISAVRDTGGRVTLSMYECRKPIIGAINGLAVGVGATMTLGMDIRLASEKAKFGFVFSKIGITNEACSSWFLPRIVGVSQALEWFYKGNIFKADEALQGGLVKAIYPPEQLLDEAYALAGEIAQNTSPVSVALTRQMVYRLMATDHPMEAHKVDSLSMFYTSINDGKEGVNSFLEKRKPVFKSSVNNDMPPFYPWWEEKKI